MNSGRSITAKLGGATKPRVRHVLGQEMGLSKDALQLLADTAKYPSDGIRQRNKRLEWSAYKGNKTKNELLDLGQAEAALINVGKTRKLILRPTAKARKWLEKAPREVRGGVEHEYWKEQWAERLRTEGWEVKTEVRTKTGIADIIATKNGKQIAVEIETGQSDHVGNVRRRLLEGYSEIWVIWFGKKDQVSRDLAKQSLTIPNRIKLIHCSEDNEDATWIKPKRMS